MNRVTKWQLRGIKAVFRGEKVVKLPNGQAHNVVVISTQNISFLGQYLLFGDILVNEKVFQSQALLHFVVAHEASHKSRRWILAVAGLLAAISGACALTGLVVWFINTPETTTWRDWMFQHFSFAQRLTGIIGLALIPFLWLNLSEFKADYDAICVVEAKVIRQAVDDRKRLIKYTVGSRIINALTHPPRSITLKIYSCLH
jgi:Zn-dependent protease with chaperone function